MLKEADSHLSCRGIARAPYSEKRLQGLNLLSRHPVWSTNPTITSCVETGTQNIPQASSASQLRPAFS